MFRGSCWFKAIYDFLLALFQKQIFIIEENVFKRNSNCNCHICNYRFKKINEKSVIMDKTLVRMEESAGAVVWGSSVGKVFLKVLRNSQENT